MGSKAYRRFFSYILLKWVGFYFCQFIEFGVRSGWNIRWQIPNSEGLFLAVFMVLSLPFLELIVLAWPFELALRQRGWRTVAVLFMTFIVEFFLSWFFTNQHIETWMIVKISESIILYLFLYKDQLVERIQRSAL